MRHGQQNLNGGLTSAKDLIRFFGGQFHRPIHPNKMELDRACCKKWLEQESNEIVILDDRTKHWKT